MSVANVTGMSEAEFFYERETEYFGFTPFQLLDEIGEIVVKTVFGMFDGVEQVLQEVASSFLNRGQIQAGVGQWSALVETRFGRNYELFESYIIKNVLSLPPSFVLPHRREALVEGRALKLTSFEEEEALEGQIKMLLQELQQAKQEDARLDAEERLLLDEEGLVSKMEVQLDLLKAKLASNNRNGVTGCSHIDFPSRVVGSFERMAQDLSGQLEELKSIVLETVEINKQLHWNESDELAEERWALERRLQESITTASPTTAVADQVEQLERELMGCQQIVTLEDLSSLPLLI